MSLYEDSLWELVMLFAGCSSCRSIVPLVCAGQFMPHMPTPVEPSPMGPYCPFCGQMPPFFTCTVCATTQGLFMPGMAAPPAPAMGAGPLVAPVVQAPQATSHGEVRELIMSFVREGVGAAGKAVGQGAGQTMAAWM
jgi:hypothetical protein